LSAPLRAFLIALALVTALMGWGTWYLTGRFKDVKEALEWLEPREFEGLTLVTVGTGIEYENPHRLGPATLIGAGKRAVLVDAGRSVDEALRKVRIPVPQPDTVFLTRLSPESTVGLDDLLWTGWLISREKPLRLVGPPGTRALARGLEAAHATGIAVRARSLGLPPEGARFEVVEVDGPWQASSGPLTVRAVALPGGPTPALAYRFEAAGRSVVVGTAGWGEDALVELARGADVLVEDAFWSDSMADAIEGGADAARVHAEAAWLTPLEGVGAIAARAGVPTLVLTRLRPPPLYDFMFGRIVGESFDGRLVVASDGDEIVLHPPREAAAAPPR
jgi:ribonuclease BN (tRNA processing enzyme)